MILLHLLPVLAPVFVATGLGYGWAKSGADYPSEFVGRLVINIGTPCLVVSSLAGTQVALNSLWAVMLAALLVFLLMGALAAAALRLFGLSNAVYLPPTLLPNNGNMGLPVCLFAFGDEGLALALGYFLVMMLFTFTGALVIVAGGANWRQSLKTVAQQPVLWSMVIGMVILLFRWPLPLWLANTLELLGGFAIPLMMVTLGVSLARLKVQRLGRSMLLSCARIGGGLLVGWGVAQALGLEGVAWGVVVLQSAMPVAVFTYLLALRYEREPQEVAAMVVTSTFLSLVTLPLLLWWVMPGV